MKYKWEITRDQARDALLDLIQNDYIRRDGVGRTHQFRLTPKAQKACREAANRKGRTWGRMLDRS
jgi:hypothetical protein